MTGVLLRSLNQRSTIAREALKSPQKSQDEVFHCPEESQFYSHCLEQLVLNRCQDGDRVIEFGCGDGSPVINSLLRTYFRSKIYAYELNASACQVARSRIEEYALHEQYVVQQQSFFEAERPEARYLIANPPYLPAPDDDICMPLLHGGVDGATVTNRLLSLGYANVMSLIASYSNPVGTIVHAAEQGYAIADFLVTPLPFGYYSSEPKVKNHIAAMQQQGQAFYSDQIYFLAGVLFKQRDESEVDLSAELLRVMTALSDEK